MDILSKLIRIVWTENRTYKHMKRGEIQYRNLSSKLWRIF